ncbi:MAG: hypothetical protein WAQ52_13705 [Terriglobales bacterium]
MRSFEFEQRPYLAQEGWAKIREAVDRIVDRLGRHIDPGIKDTVAALRYFEFPTDASCEGHMEGKGNAPWVHFDFIPQPLRHRLDQARKTACGNWSDPDVQALLDQAKSEMTHGSERLMQLLEEFYYERQSPIDRRLILNFFPDSVRLESQGAALQQWRTPTGRREALERFQNEMNAFTEFMKQKIF